MKAALHPHARRVLRALYELAELDVAADVNTLAQAVGARGPVREPRAGAVGQEPPRVAAVKEMERLLRELDARGLVEAARVRLTMSGLAMAARLPSLNLAEDPQLLARRISARLAASRKVS